MKASTRKLVKAFEEADRLSDHLGSVSVEALNARIRCEAQFARGAVEAVCRPTKDALVELIRQHDAVIQALQQEHVAWVAAHDARLATDKAQAAKYLAELDEQKEKR